MFNKKQSKQDIKCIEQKKKKKNIENFILKI